MNRNLAKYGNTRGCHSRYCSGKRPPDHAYCSTYSCDHSVDFPPGDAWKFYYRQQKLQQYGHEKRTLLQQLGRFYEKDLMECVDQRFRDVEVDYPPKKKPQKLAPDFYVRPWQQQFIPPMQYLPCRVHGFDRVSLDCFCGGYCVPCVEPSIFDCYRDC